MKNFTNKIGVLRRKIKENNKANWIVSICSIVFMSFFFVAMMEFVQNRSMGSTLEYLWLYRGLIFLGWVAVAAVYAAITFVSVRAWVANLFVGTLAFAFSAAHYFKTIYRGEPLMPKDFLQIKEAANITSSLNIVFTREMWMFLIAIILSTIFLAYFKLPIKKGWKGLIARLLVPVLLSVFLPFYTVFFTGNEEVIANFGFQKITGMPTTAFYKNTFVVSFLFFLSRMTPEAPEGYSKQGMQEVASELEGEEGKQSDVIIVMIESFQDISKVPGVFASEELLPNFSRLAREEGIAGSVLTQGRGGGTANAEFSALTGFAVGLMPENTIPYLEYISSGFDSLPRFYKDQGYSVVALHPYWETFYNRNNVYEYFGFEEFYVDNDFAAEGFDSIEGKFISDEDFANMLIHQYENNLATGKPIFMHGVTMQNHGEYPPDLYPEEMRVQVGIDGYSDYANGALTTFATGARASDNMIGKLTDYFRDIDRDVTLLFFGDHQPTIFSSEASEQDLVKEIYSALDLSEEEEWFALHHTPYLMWANHERKGEAGPTIAPWMLVPVMLREYGLKISPWFSWLAKQGAVLSGYLNGYYITSDGEISDKAIEEQLEVLRKQKLLQYDYMFGKKYAQDAMFE